MKSPYTITVYNRSGEILIENIPVFNLKTNTEDWPVFERMEFSISISDATLFLPFLGTQLVEFNFSYNDYGIIEKMKNAKVFSVQYEYNQMVEIQIVYNEKWICKDHRSHRVNMSVRETIKPHIKKKAVLWNRDGF